MAIHLFNEEYSIKRGEKTTENQGRDERKGLTVHAGLLPVLTSMEKLLFRRQANVIPERGILREEK